MAGINPGSWVNPENVEEQPWKTYDGIVKFMEFPVRIPEMSARAFHIYWQKHHSPHTMSIVPFSQFMRKYVSGHRFPDLVLDVPSHYRQDAPFDGIGEVWLNSLSEVEDWLSHPLYPQLIAPDEPRFISTEGGGEFIVVKEERLFEPELDMVENMMTKVYLLQRSKAGLSYDDAHTAASAHGRAILEQDSLKQCLRKFAISHKLREPFPIEGFELDDIDTVFEFWFAEPADAEDFFKDPAYGAAILPIEDKAFDTKSTRALIARLRVVHDEFSFQPSTTQPLPFFW